MEKSLFLLAARREAELGEGGREREKEREPPHSINYMLLCNFTLTYTQTQRGVGTLVNGYVRKCTVSGPLIPGVITLLNRSRINISTF